MCRLTKSAAAPSRDCGARAILGVGQNSFLILPASLSRSCFIPSSACARRFLGNPSDRFPVSVHGRRARAPLRIWQLLGRLHNKPRLDFLARPGCFPQEGKTGLHTRVMEKATDRDAPPHLCPAVLLDQFFYDGLKRDAVQWIAGMKRGRRHGGGRVKVCPGIVKALLVFSRTTGVIRCG